MEQKKSAVKFTKVEETMLFPLYGRALYSMNPDNEYRDEDAERLLSMLEVNLEELKEKFDKVNQIGCSARAISIDETIKEYIQLHPQATVVNIGAGRYILEGEQLTSSIADTFDFFLYRDTLRCQV